MVTNKCLLDGTKWMFEKYNLLPAIVGPRTSVESCGDRTERPIGSLESLCQVLSFTCYAEIHLH